MRVPRLSPNTEKSTFSATTTAKTIDIFQKYRVRRYDFIPRSPGELNLHPFSILLKFTFFFNVRAASTSDGGGVKLNLYGRFLYRFNNTRPTTDVNERWGVRGCGGMGIGVGNRVRFAMVSAVSREHHPGTWLLGQGAGGLRLVMSSIFGCRKHTFKATTLRGHNFID